MFLGLGFEVLFDNIDELKDLTLRISAKALKNYCKNCYYRKSSFFG
jgi:hypothetical protein